MLHNRTFNIVFIGDVVSKTGMQVLTEKLPTIIQEHQIDFIIVNGENTTNGRSLSWHDCQKILALGVHVITSGNHIYDLPEVQQYINDVPQLLRPVNLNVLLPGRGTNVFVMQEKSIRVTNLVGQIFMDPADSPFCAIEKILKNDHSDIHVVDFHAETTSEKAALAYCYDGQLTAVVGTHTHIPTCDERILPQKTAFVTDLGMTGNYHSILGVRSDIIIDRLRLGLKKRFVFPTGSGKLSGVVVQINRNSNLAERIYRICY